MNETNTIVNSHTQQIKSELFHQVTVQIAQSVDHLYGKPGYLGLSVDLDIFCFVAINFKSATTIMNMIIKFKIDMINFYFPLYFKCFVFTISLKRIPLI